MTGERIERGWGAGAFVRRMWPLETVWVGPLLALLLGLWWARYGADAGGDMAAQVAWAHFVARHPGSAADLAWYGGAYPGAYSLLAPPLMALLGVRLVAVAALVASAALLAVLVGRGGVRWPGAVSAWGAFALWCNVAAGRISFAVGIAFGLAALVLALDARVDRWRLAGCVVTAGLATAASPLAGLFLEVAAAALILTPRHRVGWALAVPPVLVVGGAALLFPTFGVDPVEASTVLATAVCAVAVACLVPRSWRTLRIAALVYAAGALVTWGVDTPIGGNVGRLAMVFASVPLLGALASGVPWPDGPSGASVQAEPVPHGRIRARLRTAALLVAFAATAYWLVAADLVGLPPAVPHAAEAAALTAELRALHAERARVEAVPMSNHWEAWGLADTVELARGWNRQLDLARDPLFYDDAHALRAADYHRWLRSWAVRYVVLADGPPDVAAQDEADVIRAAPPWLRPVWHGGPWSVFEVTDAEPLAAPPARTVSADAAQIVLTAPTGPATIPLRVPWSPWLNVTGPGPACLSRSGDWTEFHVTTPGTYRVTAPLTWPRGSPCRR